MKLFLFVFLALASAGPLERLVQKVATPSLSLLRRCIDGKPILLDMENLPGNGRAAGDPCAEDEQCRTGLKCLCQAHGGKECTNQCVMQDVVIPSDGEYHNVHCTANCQCTETGELECVDMCPPVAIDCPAGQDPIMLLPSEGQCCGTPSCSAPVAPAPSGYRSLEGDCAAADVTASLSFPQDTIQKYVIGSAQVDVGLAASCCKFAYSPCGSKSYTAPQNWEISKENYLKASGFGSAARITSLGLSLVDQNNPNNQPTPVKLGTDISSVVVEGGGYCGEGRITADLNGDQGTYGTTHNGARFDTVSLSLEDCAAWCNSFPTCAGFSWKTGSGALLDGNCVLRSAACTASTVVTTDMKFYVKGVQQ